LLNGSEITIVKPLSPPWRGLDYEAIMARPGGCLVNDGRSSKVHRFDDPGQTCFLKRYRYRKIHWRHCLEKSQVAREYENLERIRQADLGCRTIEILAFGERRRWRVLLDAFLLSRAVPGGRRLSLFLAERPADPRRAEVVAKLIAFGARVIASRLAIPDLFFRNLVVVPDTAELYLLDVQHCRTDPRRAARKSWPQFWADCEIFLTPAEKAAAAEQLAASLPEPFSALAERAAAFIPKEEKRRRQELTLAATGPEPPDAKS
jgi:hypothetical protein